MNTMDTSNRHNLPERNPKTYAVHRRQVFWQVTLPLVVGILLVLGTIVLIILSATQPVTDLDRWADVSLVWLILPSLFFALILLIILVGVVYAITVIFRLVPRYARVVQLYFELGKDKVSHISNRVVEPILKMHSIWAVLHRQDRWKD